MFTIINNKIKNVNDLITSNDELTLVWRYIDERLEPADCEMLDAYYQFFVSKNIPKKELAEFLLGYFQKRLEESIEDN